MDGRHRSSTCLVLCWLSLAVLVLGMSGCGDDGPGGPKVNPHNALLSGPWILVPPESQIETNPPCYLVFDGEGTVTDWGVFSPGSPPGTYSMKADSSGTMHLQTGHDSAVDCAVKLTSGSTGYLTGLVPSEEHADIEKVLDTSLMGGLWAGQMQVPGRTIPCTIEIDDQGVIGNCTGLAGPVTGRAYANPEGLAVAFLRTGEPGGFSQVHLHTGVLAADTWSGALGVDQENGDGTFSFSRE